MTSSNSSDLAAARVLSQLLTTAIVRRMDVESGQAPCFSCGHEYYFHTTAGCTFTVLAARPDTDARCACSVLQEPEDPQHEVLH